jgi:hypothetical protein
VHQYKTEKMSVTTPISKVEIAIGTAVIRTASQAILPALRV